MTDAFTSRLGVSEGRVVDASGALVFVLGDLESGRFNDLAVGDYVEIAQTTDLTGVEFVRVRGSFRAPPAGAWRLSIRIAGVDVASLPGWPGRTRVVSDLVANVSAVKGPVEIALRLTFVGTA